MITKIKSVIIFHLLFFVNFSCADVAIDVLCLSSGSNKPIDMEMRIYYDTDAKWSGGFVKYKNSKKPISIFLLNSIENILSEDAPHQFTDSWVEVVNGKISGMYEIIRQGAQVPSASYESYPSKKRFYFQLNNSVDGTPESGCVWK